MSKPRVIVAALCVVVVLAGVGLWAFQPWRLFTSSEVDQAAPVSEPVAQEPTEETEQEEQTDEGEPPAASPTPQDTVLGAGPFEDAEHATSGDVRLIPG